MLKPYYVIEFTAAACMFEIYVNDIPVVTSDFSGQLSSMVPANYGILGSGIHSLKARMMPHSGQTVLDPEAVLLYKLKLYDVSYGFQLQNEIIQYNFPKPDESKMIPYAEKTDTFQGDVPYSLAGWKNGLDLKDEDDIDYKLRKAYKRIAAMIENKQYDQFLSSIANREEIMATSMYLNDQKARGRMNRLIKDFENGFTLMPLPENAVVRLHGNGKVAALKKLNGEPALSLYNPETEEELMIELGFYIPAGKTEFEVI